MLSLWFFMSSGVFSYPASAAEALRLSELRDRRDVVVSLKGAPASFRVRASYGASADVWNCSFQKGSMEDRKVSVRISLSSPPGRIQIRSRRSWWGTPIRVVCDCEKKHSSSSVCLTQESITVEELARSSGGVLELTSVSASTSIRPFVSDECSGWPEGTLQKPALWRDCCYTHDLAYWMGGTRRQRVHADEVLKTCVSERYNSAEGMLMYLGVRVGGAPYPTSYRWGYGWTGARGYQELSAREIADAVEELKNAETSSRDRTLIRTYLSDHGLD